MVRGTLTKFCRYLAAPLDGYIGIEIKELYYLVAPLAPANGTLMCRSCPVGNHWSNTSFDNNMYHDNSESDIDAVEDWNCAVFIRWSDRFPAKGLENVPCQDEDEQEIEAEIPVEETS